MRCGRINSFDVKIEKEPGFKVLVIAGRGSVGPSFIPSLWERLNRKEVDIWYVFKSTSEGYGVMNKCDSVTKELDYLAGREAKPDPEAPEGM